MLNQALPTRPRPAWEVSDWLQPGVLIADPEESFCKTNVELVAVSLCAGTEIFVDWDSPNVSVA